MKQKENSPDAIKINILPYSHWKTKTQEWLSLKSTIENLGEWEMLYNLDFNSTEFGRIKMLQVLAISKMMTVIENY